MEERYEQIARYHARSLRRRLQAAAKVGWADIEEVCRQELLAAAEDAGHVWMTGYLPKHLDPRLANGQDR